MDKKELFKKSVIDLKEILLIYLKEQFNLRLQLSSGKLKKLHLIKKVRRNIAVIKTLLKQKVSLK